MAVKPAGNSGENAEDIAEINSGVPFGKYFDVGNSKDELGAHNTMDDLCTYRSSCHRDSRSTIFG